MFVSVVIFKLDQLFVIFGIFKIVRLDNGLFFNGEEFVKFVYVFGFKYCKVILLWFRVNGEVERFVKILKKCFKVVKVEGRNWRKEL